MRYTYLLFDADNTLLDFDENERVSLSSTFKTLGIPYDDASLELYHEINIMYWRMMDQGLIEREVLLTKRFETFFEKLGIVADAQKTEDMYRENLGKGSQMVPGALELCKDLKNQGYKLYIITNGVAKTQHDRLNASGLASLMDGIFISEEIGYNKPHKAFFDYVSSHIENFDPKRALVIGDSLTSDIKGGNDSGIDTCYINFYNKKNTTDIVPKYEVLNIVDVKSLLLDL